MDSYASHPCATPPRPSGGRLGAAAGLDDGPVVAPEIIGTIGARRRLRVGDTGVEIRDFARQRPVQIKPTAAVVVLLAPLAGSAEIVTESGHYSLRVGDALLLARDEAATAVWFEGSRALFLHLPRVRLQALASAEFGDPRRLGGVNVELEGGDDAGSLRAAMMQLITHLGADPEALGRAGRPVETPFLAALIRALRDVGDVEEIFPVARSVKRAVDYVRERRQQVCGLEELASAAGVTPATLRQGFRACLGASIGGFVQNMRLDWAHERLGSGQDSRPVAQLALDAGFSGAGVFSRAYQRRFGEIPSQTRARAVRVMGT